MSATVRVDELSFRRSHNGTLAVFWIFGFAFTSWMARLPEVKATLRLTPGGLGLLLLALSMGSVLGLPSAGRISHRFGPANSVRLGAVIALPAIALASLAVQARAAHALVAIALFLVGLGMGIWDVAQNLEGSIVERSSGRAIMPRFHAGFSLGTVFGGLVAAACSYVRLPIGLHVTTACVVCATGVVWATARFTEAKETDDNELDDATAESSAFRSAWLEPRTLLIGVMVLAAAFTEGTANDWLAVAFVDGHHVSKPSGVLAFTVFVTAMTLGRIVGTRLLDRFGRVAVLRALFMFALIGCAFVVFGEPWLAYAGAALWGFGASLGFPVGMSAAADDPRRGAMRLSVVSTIGYLAFLAGPPLLGFLGNHVGTLRALLAAGVMSVFAILVVPVAQPPVEKVD